MAAERHTFQLADGTEIVLRRLNQIDAWELSKIPDTFQRTLRAAQLAIVSPAILTEGVPEAQPNGKLHVRDLPDEDLDVIYRQVHEFALGGARAKAPFRASGAGSAPRARRPGAKVRKASE